MLKKQMLFGCALALVVAGNCVGMKGGGDAVASHHVNPRVTALVATIRFGMIAQMLSESFETQREQSGNQWAAPVVQNGKGSVKRGKKGVARVAYARELKESFDAASQKFLDGVVANDAEIRVAVKDQGYCPTGKERAVVGELSQPVYTAFMRAYRAMMQRLLAKGYNRAARVIKLQKFCESVINFVENESRWEDRGAMQQLFCLAADQLSSNSSIDHLITIFLSELPGYATEDQKIIRLLHKIVWHMGSKKRSQDQNRLVCHSSSVSGVVEAFEAMTLGEEDAAEDQEFYAWLDEELGEEDDEDADHCEEDKQPADVEVPTLSPVYVVATNKPVTWPMRKNHVSVKPETAPCRQGPVQREVRKIEARELAKEDCANINLIEEAQKEAIIAAKKLKETRTPASESAARKLKKRRKRKKVPLSDDEWVVGFSAYVSPTLKKEIKRLKSRVRAVLEEAERLAQDVAVLREHGCPDVEDIIMPCLADYKDVLNCRADTVAVKKAFNVVCQELTAHVGATRQTLEELAEQWQAVRSAARQNKTK